MENSLPVVALVGPPNAGKSTLLNKIAGKHLAVTSKVAGTTRDRQYLDVSWNQKNFSLVDTAGLIFAGTGELETNVQKQIEVAVEEADLIVLLADGKEPVSAIDAKVLKKFRSLDKPIVLAVNKLDSPRDREEKLSQFLRYGIKSSFAVSAITGRGIGDMLDCIVSLLPEKELSAKQAADISIKVSIVGKPNVGKSTIFNAILKEERAVVSPVPGTTRNSVDSDINIGGIDYTFIDTAGLKKKAYRQTEPDVFSGFMSYKSIRRSDVCFLVVDSIEEITKQDQRVASEIFGMQKGCVILANKIDLYKGSEDKLRDYLSPHFPFLWMCPVFFISGLTGQGMQEAVAAVKPIFEARNKKIDNQILAEFLSKKLKANPPKLLRDQKKPKVFSLHQTEINPPKFELLVNHPAAISQQFKKFVENSIIKELEFWGTPITLKTVGKDKT